MTSKQERRRIIKNQLLEQGYQENRKERGLPPLSVVRDWSPERIEKELGYSIRSEARQQIRQQQFRGERPRDLKGRFLPKGRYGYNVMGTFEMEVNGKKVEYNFKHSIGTPNSGNIMERIDAQVDKIRRQYGNKNMNFSKIKSIRYFAVNEL